MDKQIMILHNESAARNKIRRAYLRSGVVEAMRLCMEFMGMDAKAAYQEVQELCADVWKEATR